MKTQTIQIEAPQGFEIDSFDKASGKITFKEKPKSVFERIKTVQDLLAANDRTERDFDEECEDLAPDEKAYRLIKMLAKTLNEGWTPDWNNSNELKYYPYFDMRGPSGFRFGGCADWLSSSDVGSRLAFKSRELAEHAGKNFTDVYKTFMTIN